MIRALLLSLAVLLLSALSTQRATAAANDSIRLSLLTCAPGGEIYSLFGHTAIRYENQQTGVDVVFNYGLFDFNAPNFVFRFSLGETDYCLGAEHYQEFTSAYERSGRSVYQQELNLNIEEKEALFGLLEENYRPENRIYRYNFFFDNCATRPRDKIEESIRGDVVYARLPADGSKTFREIVHECTKNNPWSRFGIDFCIGRDADRPITQRQMMFAPFYLMEFFAGAQINKDGESRPLVIGTKKVIDVQPDEESRWQITPMQTMLLAFILTTIATIYGLRTRKALWAMDAVLFSLAGVAGCLLAFLALFSQHPAVSTNYLLFVFHPAQLFAVPFLIYCERKGKKCGYHLLNFTVLTLFMVLFLLIPQRIDVSIVPLALCLLLRSASHLVLTYKKRS